MAVLNVPNTDVYNGHWNKYGSANYDIRGNCWTSYRFTMLILDWIVYDVSTSEMMGDFGDSQQDIAHHYLAILTFTKFKLHDRGRPNRIRRSNF